MIHDSDDVRGSGCISAVLNVVNDVLLLTDLRTEVAVNSACGITNSCTGGLVNNDVLEGIIRPTRSLENIGGMGYGMGHINSGDADGVGEHNTATVLAI